MIGACSSIDGSAGEETSFCFVAGPEVGVGIGVAFEAALVPALEVVAVSCLDEALLEGFLISFACSFSLGASALSFALSSFPSASASFIGVGLVLAVGVYFALPLRFVTMAGKEGFRLLFLFLLGKLGWLWRFLRNERRCCWRWLDRCRACSGTRSRRRKCDLTYSSAGWCASMYEGSGRGGWQRREFCVEILIRWRRIRASGPSNNTRDRVEPSCACNDAWCNTRPYRGRSMRDRQEYCNTVGHEGWRLLSISGNRSWSSIQYRRNSRSKEIQHRWGSEVTARGLYCTPQHPRPKPCRRRGGHQSVQIRRGVELLLCQRQC